LDNVNEELARAKFSFACLLQDRPPLELISQRELEKETSDLFFDGSFFSFFFLNSFFFFLNLIK